jgi:microcystin-dependent protein
MSDPFIGEIRMVGFNFAPYGWALCQGQTIGIPQNQALFSLLGVSFGGNGTTTFQLPDLQGRSPVGTGHGLGLSPITIGEIGGTENATLTTGNMPAHTHTATVTGGITVTGTVAIPATTSTTGGTGTPGANAILGTASNSGRALALYNTSSADATLKPFNVSSTGDAPTIQNSLAGSNLPFSIRNPYLGLTCIIALNGIFPSRG